MTPTATPGPKFRYCPFDGRPLTVAADGRPSCTQCGFVDYQNPKPGVAIVVADAQGRVLLGRRRFEPRRGMWDIPGGFIDGLESAEHAAIRECREETGLEVVDLEYLGSASDVYGPERMPILDLAYLARRTQGVASPNDDIDQLRWFAPDELPAEMAFPHQRQVLQWAQDRLGRP